MRKQWTGISLSWKPYSPAVVIAASILLPVLLINPFREMLSADDSWAYARMVETMLASGKYRLDSWAAANMPVQIWLGAAASKLFGYSLAVLRSTTLVLFAVALTSFYQLLRELRRPRSICTVCTLALAASPLVLALSFTFMSDVQFLGWFLLALWLYTRGLLRRSLGCLFLGSIAATLAIGTRQFGIALIGGFLVSWSFAGKQSRMPAWHLLAGLALPIAAGAAQINMGLQHPNFTQAYRTAEQGMFLHTPLAALMYEMCWRVLLVLQYSGMCLAPVFVLLLSRRPRSAKTDWLFIAGGSLAVVVALVISSPLTARPEAQHRGFWEPLELYWFLPTVLGRLNWLIRFLDTAGILGAGWLVLSAVRFFRDRKLFSPAAVLLIGTAASLLILHLVYVQFNDTYIAAFLPFALLAAGHSLRDAPSRLQLIVVVLSCIGFTLGMSFWLRGQFDKQQAAWASADKLLQEGIAARNIDAPLHWSEYNGAFDDWIDAGAPGFDSRLPSFHGTDALHDPFYVWLEERFASAKYRIADESTPQDPSWSPMRYVDYRNAILRSRRIVTLRRR